MVRAAEIDLAWYGEALKHGAAHVSPVFGDGDGCGLALAISAHGVVAMLMARATVGRPITYDREMGDGI